MYLPSYPLGWLADRHSRVVMTVASVFGMAAAVSLVGLATQFWHVLLLFGLLGVNEALFMPASSAMILEDGRSHGMGATMGLFNTAIVYGYTNVERTTDYVERTGNPRLLKYHFMRTYVGSSDHDILLLGNHTMEVWREGQDS